MSRQMIDQYNTPGWGYNVMDLKGREALLECGGLTPLYSHRPDDGFKMNCGAIVKPIAEKRRQAAALQTATKHPVTLIEVLIAVILTVLILSTLMFFYRQVTEIGQEIDRVNGKNFNLRYIEARLGDILPKALGEKDTEKDFVFFSVGDEGLTKPGSQSLIFTFENQASLAKAFSNHVLARIYLDKNGNLMIAYWPSPKRWVNQEPSSMKKEMLYQGVEDLSFEFYIAPPAKDVKEPVPEKQSQEERKNPTPDQEKKAVEPEPKGDWRKQPWLEEFKQLPVMVKMILKMPKGEEPLIFIYPLANTKSHITYE